MGLRAASAIIVALGFLGAGLAGIIAAKQPIAAGTVIVALNDGFTLVPRATCAGRSVSAFAVNPVRGTSGTERSGSTRTAVAPRGRSTIC